MVTVAYNAYCVISMEGDDDTCDGKTAGSHSWKVGATVNSLVVTLFHVIITRMGTDLIFLSRLGSTICFTSFGSHDPIVLYWNPWYTEPCYKGSLLYCKVLFSRFDVTSPMSFDRIMQKLHDIHLPQHWVIELFTKLFYKPFHWFPIHIILLNSDVAVSRQIITGIILGVDSASGAQPLAEGNSIYLHIYQNKDFTF